MNDWIKISEEDRLTDESKKLLSQSNILIRLYLVTVIEIYELNTKTLSLKARVEKTRYGKVISVTWFMPITGKETNDAESKEA